MTAKKRGLGRGLDSLLGNQDAAEEGSGQRVTGNLREVPIERIQPNSDQPRRTMDADALEDLANSIRAQGLLQPLVVRELENDRFEIIAGERRWRASQQAGIKRLPVHIKKVTGESSLAMAVIENIQREDLNAMEQAQALKRLQQEFGLTHKEIAREVGKSRTAVTNLIRLTTLEPEVARMLERGDIEMGHARALLGSASQDLSRQIQVRAAREVVERNLNVRQTEQLVKSLQQSGSKPEKRRQNPDTRRLEGRLSEHIGQPVRIRESSRGRGRLVISYASLDELEGVMERLGFAGGD